MICLDTCFIIDLLRGLKGAEKRAREIDETEGAAISVISVFELLVGVGALGGRGGRKREMELRSVLDNLLMLQLDFDSAEEAARILTDSRASGEIQQNDALIAGTCTSRGIKALVTRDPKHFSGVRGLRVETY